MDFTGRMTTLTDTNGSVFAYEFDAEGNRLYQALNDCQATCFVHDGPDVLLELNPTNGVAYAWVNGPGIDQPIERIMYLDGTPRARRVFHSDALGSIAALTDPSGLVTQSYAYSAFGSLRSSTGPDPNRVTYTAREQLGDSQGWMYFRHRLYSPLSGRFTSPDLLGFRGGINGYIYANNWPIHARDPWGLLTVLVWNEKGKGEDKYWGHASLELDDGTYISWWPSSENLQQSWYSSKVFSSDADPKRSRERDEDAEERAPDSSIYIEGLDECAIKTWWEGFRNSHQWKSLSQNCSTTVAEALKAGGADVNWWDTMTAHNLVWSPADVLSFANAINRHMASQGSKSTQGKCQPCECP